MMGVAQSLGAPLNPFPLGIDRKRYKKNNTVLEINQIIHIASFRTYIK